MKSFVAGVMFEPAAGSATITGFCDGGNQLTCVAAPTVSHGRGATAIRVEPVAARRPSEIVLVECVSVCGLDSVELPCATALTGRSKPICTSSPGCTVIHRSVTCAIG